MGDRLREMASEWMAESIVVKQRLVEDPQILDQALEVAQNLRPANGFCDFSELGVLRLLQGIVDAITGPLGIVIGTLALIGVFLSWLFGILDFRQALWVVVAIAGIAAAPTIVAAIWTT